MTTMDSLIQEVNEYVSFHLINTFARHSLYFRFIFMLSIILYIFNRDDLAVYPDYCINDLSIPRAI